MKQYADINFKFDENGRKLKKYRKQWEMGEIVRYKQFLLYPQCFQKTLSADT